MSRNIHTIRHNLQDLIAQRAKAREQIKVLTKEISHVRLELQRAEIDLNKRDKGFR